MNEPAVELGRSPYVISKRRLFLICIVLFLTALGVRLLVWQNNKSDVERVMSGVTQPYQSDARTLLNGDVGKFISGENPPIDASVLAHPPGYPIFIAAVYRILGDGDSSFRVVQILFSSLAAIFSFFIAFRLFDIRTSIVAALLTAISPQLAYYAGIILPDELSAVLILTSLYFFVRAAQDQKLRSAVLSGVFLGLSCWFRANSLLLPVFFAVTIFFLLPKRLATRFATFLVISFIFTISPITIRNWVVFHSFIPLSLGTGTTFVEGLGDYDSDGQLGMPSTDEGVMEMDARSAERPDYYGNLYSPDGVERERQRIKTGLSVVTANPGWYAISVLHRGTMTFRMERVPVVAAHQGDSNSSHPLLYYLNLPLKLFQKLFITAVFLPLILFGAIIMLWKKPQRMKLAMLAAVPIYFASIQSLLHTEYRYLLPAAHVLIIIAAVSLSALIGWIQKLNFQRSNSKSLAGS